MKKLEGRVALVTGSGRNIGRAIALALAAEGANVVVNARSNEAEARAVAGEARALGVKAISIVADVADREQVDRMVSTAQAELGGIDILVNNAAVRPSISFTEVTPEDWEWVRGVVLDGGFYCTRAVVPSMVEKGFGRILFILGDGAFVGTPNRSLVSAAKMGLVGLTRGLAQELGSHNIRVNSVSPGVIDTTRQAAWYPDGVGLDPGPLGRLGEVEEIASTCLFLVSEDSAFITGQTIHVNGGGGVLG